MAPRKTILPLQTGGPPCPSLVISVRVLRSASIGFPQIDAAGSMAQTAAGSNPPSPPSLPPLPPFLSPMTDLCRVDVGLNPGRARLSSPLLKTRRRTSRRKEEQRFLPGGRADKGVFPPRTLYSKLQLSQMSTMSRNFWMNRWYKAPQAGARLISGSASQKTLPTDSSLLEPLKLMMCISQTLEADRIPHT